MMKPRVNARLSTGRIRDTCGNCHPLLAQLFFVEAGLPQFSTPCSSAVVITSIAIIVMAIPGPDIDTSRPDLHAHLREC
jgi:hypothetical protein